MVTRQTVIGDGTANVNLGCASDETFTTTILSLNFIIYYFNRKKLRKLLIRPAASVNISLKLKASACTRSYMSTSDTETLCDELISPCKPKLGKRGRLWKNKLFDAIASKLKIKRLKALGWTDEEIVYEEPGYYYDDEYHGLGSEKWFRRNKSCSDLSSAVGTAAGYSAWEYCGERCHTMD
jgi:hypothetical protein